MKNLLPDAERDQLTLAFKALSNPNRLAIYMEVLEREETDVPSCALGALVDLLDIGAPTISHHIKELLNAGLIDVERQGKFIRCKVKPQMRLRLAAFFNRDAELAS